MIPVYQDLTVANDGTGNCFNACVASILERSLREVCQTLPDCEPDRYWDEWINWAGENGIDIRWQRAAERPPRGYAIAKGVSTRTYPDAHEKAGNPITHACVVFDGQLVHDPYPGGSGVDRISGYWTITHISILNEGRET